MSKAIGFPRPSILDVMERVSLDGQIEEALILSMKYHVEDRNHWNAVLVTRNGFEFVAHQREFRSKHDWRPKGWEYNRKINAFLPPEAVYDTETQTYSVPETSEEKQMAADLACIEIVAPAVGEKYMAWRARAYKAAPELKSNPKAGDALAHAWKSRVEADFLA
jgi:hypothetical protein